jgi:hypothetical protein
MIIIQGGGGRARYTSPPSVVFSFALAQNIRAREIFCGKKKRSI